MAVPRGPIPILRKLAAEVPVLSFPVAYINDALRRRQIIVHRNLLFMFYPPLFLFNDSEFA